MVVAEPTCKQNGGKMKTRNIVLSSIIGALYVVLTIGLAPFSFGPIQFRISEILKVFVLYNPFLTIGIGIGTLFANIFSPYAGPWELIWMPFTDMAGGLIAWAIYYYVLHKHSPVFSMTVYALTTGASVALMLTIMGAGEFWFNFISVGLSELIILIIGIPVIFGIEKILSKRGINIRFDKI